MHEFPYIFHKEQFLLPHVLEAVARLVYNFRFLQLFSRVQFHKDDNPHQIYQHMSPKQSKRSLPQRNWKPHPNNGNLRGVF